MGLSCGGKCGMFFLVLINTIFLLFGIGLLVLGIIMHVNAGVLNDTEIQNILGKVSLNGITLGTLISSLSIISICLGCFIILVAGMGAFGACCKVRCLLVVYAIIVTMLLIIQIAAIALYAAMQNKVEDTVKSEMTSVLKEYEGPAATDETSNGWNLLFIGMDCCGVEGPTSARDEFANTNWAASRGSDKIPYSCCSSSTTDNYRTGTETTCTQSYTNYRRTNCYDAIYNWFNQYYIPAIVVGCIVLVLEIIGVLFAFILCRDIGRGDMIV